MTLDESAKQHIRASVTSYSDYGQGAVERAQSKAQHTEEKLGELLIALVENHILTEEEACNL